MNQLLRIHGGKDFRHEVELPFGLQELMADITREVLRDQPLNLYEYIADYLDGMLKVRTNLEISEYNLDSTIQLSMTITDLLQATGMSYKNVEQCAFSIRNAMMEYELKHRDEHFPINRQFYEEEILTKLLETFSFKEDEIAKINEIIQICFKDFVQRRRKFIVNSDEIPTNVRNTLLYHDGKVPDDEVLEKAATKIQSQFRGFSTRKKLEIAHSDTNFILKKCLAMIGEQPVIPIIEVSEVIEEKVPAINISDSTTKWVIDKCLSHIDQLHASKIKVVEEIIKDYNSSSDAIENAAIKIQAAYRGHGARKQYRAQKDVLNKNP